jgi:predicted LPLAT superfamily acyltransferase
MSGAAASSWRSRAEVGTLLGIRTVVWIGTRSRTLGRLVARGAALWTFAFAAPARRAIRAYLAQLGEPTTSWRVLQQFFRFAEVGLDAMYFLTGHVEPFELDRDGTEYLREVKRSGGSAILLGAHVGSFYAMRAMSRSEDFPLYIVAYTQHAERINRVLRELSPESHAQILEMSGGVEFMMRLRDLAEEGALIAILADRVGREERSATVDFLGAPARFPTGPYLLASTLKLPVYLTFGLYESPRTYRLSCRPFAERVVLPRGRRQEALEEYVARYAAAVEAKVRQAPDNWFNFYEFWEPSMQDEARTGAKR